jgi:hypothetical protein
MNSTTQPSYAFPPTKDPVVTDWYEVAASFDSRTDLPRVMAVGAVNADGILDTFWSGVLSISIEIQMPNGLPGPLDFPYQRTIQPIDFPVKFRINKPETAYPMTYALYGTGVTATSAD